MSHGSEPEIATSVTEILTRYEGDQAALVSALYDEYAAMVFGFLEHLTGDRHLAESLLVPVFLELPQALSRFGSGKHSAGILIIRHARAIAVSAMKQIKAPTNGSNRDDTYNVNESSSISQQVLTPQVDKAVSVLELVYSKGYTFGAIAQLLGKTESEVRLALRNELKKYRAVRSVLNKLNPDA